MIGFKNLKIPNMVKNIIKILILFLILFLYFSAIWINKNYEDIPLGEAFFHIFSKTNGFKKTTNFIIIIFLKSIFFSWVLVYISNKINDNIIKEKNIILKIKRFNLFNRINFFERKKDFLLNINILKFKFKLTIKIKRKLIFYILMILKIFIMFYLIKTSLNILKPTEYFNYLEKASNFIEKNYVDPKNVNISFPKKKQNLSIFLLTI